jgi:hypothetical protein
MAYSRRGGTPACHASREVVRTYGYPEPARLSLTPGNFGGPRGQGPKRTNPAPGKRRADARIQNPSGACQLGNNPSQAQRCGYNLFRDRDAWRRV